MKQKLNAVLNDDRGVSPVIGVILMVAITVILAAVIGTFVLGLGDSLEQAPQAQLNADATNDGENLEINHNGGDGISTGDIRIIAGDGSVSGDSTNVDLSGEDDQELNVGDNLNVSRGDFSSTPSGETQVRLVHTPSESILLDTEVTFSNS